MLIIGSNLDLQCIYNKSLAHKGTRGLEERQGRRGEEAKQHSTPPPYTLYAII